MPVVSFPYGKEVLQYTIPGSRFKGELVSQMHHYRAECSQEELVRDALTYPIGTPPPECDGEGQEKDCTHRQRSYPSGSQ
jgi:hypothetical protein